MTTQRETVEATLTLITSREYSHTLHEDPARRGGYLLILPGEIPEIVLDGLARPEEQERARRRCLIELEQALQSAQDREVGEKRRSIVRVERSLVVTRSTDPMVHQDPNRRGGYLLSTSGMVPEIVLDGLATPEEQAAAEKRLLPLAQAEAARIATLVQQRPPSTPQRAPCVTPPHGLRTGSAPPSPRATPPPSLRTGNATPPPRVSDGSKASSAAAERLGQRLLARGLLSQESLEDALRMQERLPGARPIRRLGSLLVESGTVSSAQMVQALGQLRGVEACSNTSTRLDAAMRQLFPLDVLLELQAAPLHLIGQTLVVVMCDPHVKEHVARLQSLSRYRLRPMQALQSHVHRIIESIRVRHEARAGRSD